MKFTHFYLPSPDKPSRPEFAKTLLNMKLIILILLYSLQLSARTNAQGNKITISATNVPIEKVFKDIEKQSGLILWYEKKIIDPSVKVTIHLKDASVSDALAECLKGQALTFAIEGNTVVISAKPKETTGAAPPGPVNETIDIKGKVTNEKGEPLVGASIQIKGSQKGTKTDKDGAFSLPHASKEAVLLVSFTGYANKEQPVAGKDFIFIALQISNSPLDAIQIIAYGTTTQRLNTGDVTTITSKDIEKSPVTNVLQALEGRVPGMFIQQQSGVPGSGYTVQIRGQNSISNGSLPLYVVDGVPYNTGSSPSGSMLQLGFTITGTSGNPLNYLNASDIESVSVLKDADATAIYGSRGANGVVLITTKKGKSGPTKLDVNFYKGVANQARPIPVLDTKRYLSMLHEANANDGLTVLPDYYYDINGTWDTTRNTNWQKVMTGNTAQYTNADVSVSGGNDAVQYLIGGNFNKQTTVFPGDFSDQKTSIHFNLNGTSPNQKFKVILSGSYLIDNNKLPSTDFTQYQFFLAPDAPPIHNPDGSLNWANSTWTNPFAYLLQKYAIRTNNLISNAVFNYQLAKGLEIKTNLGYNNIQLNEQNLSPIESQDPAHVATNTGSAAFSYQIYSTWNIEPQLTYEMTLGKGKLKALAGTTFSDYTNNGHGLYAYGYTNDQLLGSLNGATSIIPTTISASEYKYNAAFARINYNWEDKYIINLSGRRDGSSRFGPGRQFANFGSAGAAWIFSKENFVQNNQSFLSFGKLRASYGTTGNDQIGDYHFLNLYNTISGSANSYLQSPGLYPTSIYNPNFAWEVNKKLELGLELGFLKDKLFINANYFRNRSSNQLQGFPLPSFAGISSVLENIPAVVQNKGFEVTLNATNIHNKNFTWTSSLNISFNRNELLKYPGLENTGYLATIYEVGKSLHIAKLFHSLGVNDTTGIYQFTDNKGTPTYSPTYTQDQTVIGNLDPKYYGGFQNDFNYKGIGLTIFLTFVNQIASDPLFNQGASPGYDNINLPSAIWGKYWQKKGDKARYQKLTGDYSSPASSAYNFAKTSDLIYRDASYIRLSNLSLSYTFPKSWLDKMHFKEFRVYVQGQNLLTFTGFKSDPESQNAGTISPLRIFIGGVKFSL